ncbi:sigma-54-dependent Fis family transcriptional regulator [uncultured Fusobacterium sp.]|uniref:sigma-54 interaction domain-containing protein n=1 Tax=uncultured Fusobacterium sp. TaxID=159267 RepID=UPI000BBA8C54|nr:sigma 54-interacting transcriptional regulator [uncultured Fusobacterium sp.]BBA52758.1 putative transcriptional regulator [Fusobacterium varium]
MIDNNILLKESLEAFSNFIVVNAIGEVTYINRVYARLLGINQKDAIGKRVDKIIPNTRMLNVLKTGVPEIGAVMNFFDHEHNKDVTLICNRYPVIYENKVIGAVAMTTLNNMSEVKALEKEITKIKEENRKIKKKLEHYQQTSNPLSKIIGISSEIKTLKNSIEEYAKSNFPILITGETGVGKEVFADAIQYLSNRSLNNYIKINCASIPKDLLEAELFGYEEGAFSGAKKGGKIGKFELANNGTILLDEIGEMPLSLQAKLLRVLQEKEIERVGGLETIKLNIRVICCTNCNLENMVKEKKFREDLYYRINVVELNVPPLRHHTNDIPILCKYFINKFNEEEYFEIKEISSQVLEIFKNYSWPGNVRELKHTIERAAFLCKGDKIELKNCQFFLDKKNNFENNSIINNSLKNIKDDSEKNAIITALEKSKNNKTKAAALLNINRSLLYSKLKKFDIDY